MSAQERIVISDSEDEFRDEGFCNAVYISSDDEDSDESPDDDHEDDSSDEDYKVTMEMMGNNPDGLFKVLASSQRTPARRRTRNNQRPQIEPITSSETLMVSCEFNGLTIRVDNTVEMKLPPGSPRCISPPGAKREAGSELHSADFLRVKHIIRHTQTGNIRLRGYRFRRAKYFQQLFDWMLNEVAMLVEVQGRDSKDIKIQGMVDIPLEDVKGLRELILTEKPYPQLSFREIRFPVYSQYKHERKKHIFENGRLVCRWVYTRIINDKGKSYEGSVRKIFARESDKIGRKTGEGNTPQRPITVVSGSGSTESSPSMEFLNHDPTILEQASRLDRKDPDRQYTFGDFFCGVGGTSQGAQDAGLKVRFGLDFDKDACEAYKENFPRTLVFHKDAHLFLSQDPNHIGQNHLYKDDPIRIKDLMGTDIVHLSPPCQYFSPAHTRDGKKDQANYEAIYTVAPILSLLKPRIATLEETPGLLTHRQHSNIFWALLCQLNKAGYNVRYKRANLVEYGLAQPRRRLFIMAARQDVPLPDFPKPTHGEKGSGLLQFHYVWDAFDPLRTANPRQLARDKFHQPQNMKLFTIPKTSYDPTKNFLRGLITTSGGDGYHSSGLRRHTVRENALLQSFPLDYIFVGRPSQAQRQVGNAVPPKVAKTFYQHCIKFLRAFDHGLVGIEDDPSKVDGLFDRNGKLKRRMRPAGLATPQPSQPVTPRSSDRSAAHGSYQLSTALSQRLGSLKKRGIPDAPDTIDTPDTPTKKKNRVITIPPGSQPTASPISRPSSANLATQDEIIMTWESRVRGRQYFDLTSEEGIRAAQQRGGTPPGSIRVVPNTNAASPCHTTMDRAGLARDTPQTPSSAPRHEHTGIGHEEETMMTPVSRGLATQRSGVRNSPLTPSPASRRGYIGLESATPQTSSRAAQLKRVRFTADRLPIFSSPIRRGNVDLTTDTRPIASRFNQPGQVGLTSTISQTLPYSTRSGRNDFRNEEEISTWKSRVLSTSISNRHGHISIATEEEVTPTWELGAFASTRSSSHHKRIDLTTEEEITVREESRATYVTMIGAASGSLIAPVNPPPRRITRNRVLSGAYGDQPSVSSVDLFTSRNPVAPINPNAESAPPITRNGAGSGVYGASPQRSPVKTHKIASRRSIAPINTSALPTLRNGVDSDVRCAEARYSPVSPRAVSGGETDLRNSSTLPSSARIRGQIGSRIRGAPPLHSLVHQATSCSSIAPINPCVLPTTGKREGSGTLCASPQRAPNNSTTSCRPIAPTNPSALYTAKDGVGQDVCVIQPLVSPTDPVLRRAVVLERALVAQARGTMINLAD